MAQNPALRLLRHREQLEGWNVVPVWGNSPDSDTAVVCAQRSGTPAIATKEWSRQRCLRDGGMAQVRHRPVCVLPPLPHAPPKFYMRVYVHHMLSPSTTNHPCCHCHHPTAARQRAAHGRRLWGHDDGIVTPIGSVCDDMGIIMTYPYHGANLDQWVQERYGSNPVSQILARDILAQLLLRLETIHAMVRHPAIPHTTLHALLLLCGRMRACSVHSTSSVCCAYC